MTRFPINTTKTKGCLKLRKIKNSAVKDTVQHSKMSDPCNEDDVDGTNC